LVLWALAAGSPSGFAHRGIADPSGEVWESDWPLCDVFVIRSARGYSVVRWSDGLWVFMRGDAVYGAVDRAGLQTLYASGRVTAGRMTVSVDDVLADAGAAQALLRLRCRAHEDRLTGFR
jgi:hypothetical protein